MSILTDVTQAKTLAELIADVTERGFSVSFENSAALHAVKVTVANDYGKIERFVSRAELVRAQFDILACDISRSVRIIEDRKVRSRYIARDMIAKADA